MSAQTPQVDFNGPVREWLPPTVRQRLLVELPQICAAIVAVPIESIIVPKLFTGYSPDFHTKVVMAVELNLSVGYQRHIIKVGDKSEVAQDYEGWHACTHGRMVASRIFAPAQMIELPDNRVAVVYRDAYTLFGPDQATSPGSAPQSFEDAISWAVTDNEPDPISAQRAISHIYTDLGVWFYRGATANAQRACAYYKDRLGPGKKEPEGLTIAQRWRASPVRMELRRHAIWVICGRDAPDADPIAKPARYVDPVDYLDWSLDDPSGQRLPETLVGRSHGDLHARNILVGVRRGEVQYPAVFDYGDMRVDNVIAWDFAKLETELKVRRLAELIHRPEIFQWLKDKSGLRPTRNLDPTNNEPNARRADRLAVFLAFEEILDKLTRQIDDIHSVERIQTKPIATTGIQMLDRLAGIIFRIRQEAAYWLGFQFPRRGELWRDELYCALAVYGLINVRWDYSGVEQESALVSAGAALAASSKVRENLHQAIASGARDSASYPSYRVPLTLMHADWKTSQPDSGRSLADRFVLEVDHFADGTVDKIKVRPEIRHAVPLIGQALLTHLEAGNLGVVEIELETMLQEARTFHDHETLARVGRVYKDGADKNCEREALTSTTSTPGRVRRAPSQQMYDRSFEVYAEAYALTRDWYVGINAATLALMTGRVELANQYASEVAAACKQVKQDTKNRYWLLATQGEAALILNESEEARSYYQLAIDGLSPAESRMANSSYQQVVRLWHHFGPDGDSRVGPVLEAFETSRLAGSLKKNFLGRSW